MLVERVESSSNRVLLTLLGWGDGLAMEKGSGREMLKVAKGNVSGLTSASRANSTRGTQPQHSHGNTSRPTPCCSTWLGRESMLPK